MRHASVVRFKKKKKGLRFVSKFYFHCHSNQKMFIESSDHALVHYVIMVDASYLKQGLLKSSTLGLHVERIRDHG